MGNRLQLAVVCATIATIVVALIMAEGRPRAVPGPASRRIIDDARPPSSIEQIGTYRRSSLPHMYDAAISSTLSTQRPIWWSTAELRALAHRDRGTEAVLRGSSIHELRGPTTNMLHASLEVTLRALSLAGIPLMTILISVMLVLWIAREPEP